MNDLKKPYRRENVESTIAEFNSALAEKFGFGLRPYQEHVIGDLIKCSGRFVVVSLPTGSGKTFIEMFMAYYCLKRFDSRVLVLEPTRFLCDQMYSKVWSKFFGDTVGREYEGECSSFLDPGKNIVISTPQTALKCAFSIAGQFDVVIVDEVHHAFGGKYYVELLKKLKPHLVFGFTALLPRKKLYSLDPELLFLLGPPAVLSYDFKTLVEIDPGFQSPKAIADLFDAEMNEVEESVYEELFLGRLASDPRTIKFLESTLVRYGKRAFCESLERAEKKGRILETPGSFTALCDSAELSHKARVLIEVLSVYDVVDNDELKPVIIFTSRKATASEFKRAIEDYLGLPPNRVELLTSDMSKDERLELVRRAKDGHVDVIISTLVGEEGIDIPEAGLLVMTDIPRSPLRFYQRLGRLIRLSSPKRQKYLVLFLTPKTKEYRDLESALENLYYEGVDVSYIISNLDEMSLEVRVRELIGKFLKMHNDDFVPFTIITQGRELGNPVEYLVNLARNNERVLGTLADLGINVDSDEELSEVFFRIITYPFGLRCREGIKTLLNQMDRIVNRSSFAKALSNATLERKVFYIYDVEKLSDLIAEELKRMYDYCRSENRPYYDNPFFRVDKKFILRLFMRLFPSDRIWSVKSKLWNQVRTLREYLRALIESGRVRVEVWLGKYNDWNRSLTPKILISLDIGVRLQLSVQVNYYDVDWDAYRNFLELIELNLLAVGYRGVEKFLELYEDFD